MKKILVVDNDKFMLEFMNDVLSERGHEVVTAEGGLPAVDILKTYTPDIIFVDLVMPDIDGKQLCKIIRGMPELKDVAIVILSAIAAEENIKIEEFKADACIAKGPVNEMAKHILEIVDELGLMSLSGLSEETIGVTGMYSRNITKELLSIKNHFQIILGKIAEGVLEVTSEGRIVYANSIALSIIKISEEKLLGSHFIDLFADDNRHRVAELMKPPGNKPQITTEEFPLRLNGHQVTLQFLPIDEYAATSLVILNDITERLQAEEDKKKLEAQLHQAQRMESLGTLAGGIAHNFNNLLMGIMGYASLMLLETDPDHPNHKRLKNIEKQVESGSRLTSQLLGYAREGSYEVKPISLNQLVKETSDTFGMAKKEITVHQELSEKLYGIKADQGQIEQVLLNLYVNAADAMPGGGELFLKTNNVADKDMTSKPYKVKSGNYVLLTVKDKGVGMDEETKERIFEPFFTTKGLASGTGLGMASAYGIIKGHGGYIDVDSKKGEGTTFSIYLPATEKDLEGKKVSSDELVKGKGTVLLVDDEGMVLDAVEEMLKHLGYEVLLAEDGQEALELYKENQDKIDMVLLDMVMPEMGGGETFDRIKEINTNIKVLLSSGYSIEGEAKEILKRGCDAFIQKPFKPEQLSQKIGEVLDRK